MAAVTGFQQVLESVLPWNLFDALEAGTRTFMLECACGATRDLWEAGGVKGGGTEQSTLARCADCGQRTWHRKRKKRPEERRESLLEARRDVVFLSGHAWWASLMTWGTAAMIWSTPLVLVAAKADPIMIGLV